MPSWHDNAHCGNVEPSARRSFLSSWLLLAVWEQRWWHGWNRQDSTDSSHWPIFCLLPREELAYKLPGKRSSSWVFLRQLTIWWGLNLEIGKMSPSWIHEILNRFQCDFSRQNDRNMSEPCNIWKVSKAVDGKQKSRACHASKCLGSANRKHFGNPSVGYDGLCMIYSECMWMYSYHLSLYPLDLFRIGKNNGCGGRWPSMLVKRCGCPHFSLLRCFSNTMISHGKPSFNIKQNIVLVHRAGFGGIRIETC